MANVEIYTNNWCPYCARAKQHLRMRGVNYREIDITVDPLAERDMVRRSGRHTVPQIFIDDLHVGGSDDLLAAERSGDLDRWLAGHFETPRQLAVAD